MADKNNGKANGHGFQPGESGNPAGRPVGRLGDRTLILKDAILMAAQQAGNEIAQAYIDRQLKEHGEVVDPQTVDGGLVGYLLHVAKMYPQQFVPLLGKVLPLVIQGGDRPITIEMIERADKFTRALKQLNDRADKARSVN
jgi:hypothetical protein